MELSVSCTYADKCVFFTETKKSAKKRALQQNYCMTDFEHCARYPFFSSDRNAPHNLLPDGTVECPITTAHNRP